MGDKVEGEVGIPQMQRLKGNHTHAEGARSAIAMSSLLDHSGDVIILLSLYVWFESNKLNPTNLPHRMVLTKPKRLQLSTA